MKERSDAHSAPPGNIRVLLIDDSPVFRAGLMDALGSRPRFQVIGEAQDGRVGLELALRLRPDVAVLDLFLSRLSGHALLESITRDLPSVRVVVLSAVQDGAMIYAALRTGASGYISKHADEREICDGITAAAEGTTFISRELTDALSREIRTRPRDERPALSTRELEILALIAEGFSAPAIAKRLYVSHSTVKTHIAHLFDKLGVHERCHAVAQAFRSGLLT